VADADRKVFYTDSGRKVKDGGGIEPDIVKTLPPAGQLVLQKKYILSVKNIYKKKYGIEPDSVKPLPPAGHLVLQKKITRFPSAKAQILTPEEQELELERRDLFFEYASVYEVNPLIRSLRAVLVQKYT